MIFTVIVGGSYLTIALLYGIFTSFTSVYSKNKRKFKNYTVKDILVSLFFSPFELIAILISSDWLNNRPFHNPILKVGDKLNVDGKVREVLDVAMNKDFEEVVKLSGYTMYQLGEWRLSKDIKDNKISPLQELL